MLNPRRWILALLLAILAIPDVSVALQPGELFPPLTGKTLAGDDFEFSSLKGQPVVIKLGTTWCGTCQLQGKELAELGEYLKANNIQFVDIFIQESASTIREYFDQEDRRMPDTIILDDGDIARRLNVFLIPRVILLDRDHKVFRDGETISGKNLKELLGKMLNNR